MNKIAAINAVLQKFFNDNPSVSTIPAKEMMPYFIKADIFDKDEKEGLPVRRILRKLDKAKQLHLIPFVIPDRKAINTNWFFGRIGKSILPTSSLQPIAKNKANASSAKKQTTVSETDNKDETYVWNVCDEILGLKGLRQHRFDFLLGDTGRKLPVDIYYPTLNLVIEYRETQHTNTVKHFDKPDVLTVSGVHRGEQRKLYDHRRRDVLPKHGITLIELSYLDFDHNSRHRIIRNSSNDIKIVSSKLAGIIKNPSGNNKYY